MGCNSSKAVEHDSSNALVGARQGLTHEWHRDPYEKYEIVSTLGKGSTGAAYKVKPRSKNGDVGPKYYCMKEIQIERLTDESMEELKNEIEILKELDHPNIIRPHETFEWKTKFVIVMELASGGDLYTRFPYIEDQAAIIIGKLLSAITYMHDSGITHRDIKLENIIFEDESSSEIKLIDFGFSKKFVKSKYLHERLGSVYTVAPEVVKGLYTEKADLWSVGVLAFMLLSNGEMPFAQGNTESRKFSRKQMVKNILRGSFNFEGPSWKDISQEAKDFISLLLVRDPDKRLGANQALHSKWMLNKFNINERSTMLTEYSLSQITKSFQKYCRSCDLKKLSLMIIAHESDSKDVVELREAFDQFDVADNGTITMDEFKTAMRKYNDEYEPYSDKQLDLIFSEIDVDREGKISYTEFLAASLEFSGPIGEEKLHEAFSILDTDNSGFISKDNICEVLGKHCSEKEAEEFIACADSARDGILSFDEFRNAINDGVCVIEPEKKCCS
mmetsp:Transcript_14217/g.21855  ORF Transcript_14217/g.21855 Transcript_14217/m.21855 type:complete len:502 (-) Transcript_14217:136-1641(-)|eukprot:CAMPEP_0196818982 /NCGR_PEP_ID=MMETSP1362-20130617/68479_1 /TAXON_ID=163516 /ORGANISM="Leptocylindrus danicus, Strain CCMP1856" /LENGTH=501 /DNA_ID=CAMNT_0042197297 /DNA_START=121 /DNA_END=1626 /DNA_ORIENTATION=+